MSDLKAVIAMKVKESKKLVNYKLVVLPSHNIVGESISKIQRKFGFRIFYWYYSLPYDWDAKISICPINDSVVSGMELRIYHVNFKL